MKPTIEHRVPEQRATTEPMFQKELDSLKRQNKEWLPMLDDVIEEYKRGMTNISNDMAQFKIRIDNIVEHVLVLQQNYEKFQYGTLSDRKVFNVL
jgi:hypothetical protein